MTTWFNAYVELAERGLSNERADTMMSKLAGFHPSVGVSTRGWASARLSIVAEDVQAAAREAVSLVEDAGASVAIAVEVMTESEFTAREGFAPVPDLMSVSEVAAELGVTRAGVQKMIDAGKFASATRVGNAWVIARADVLRRRALGQAEPKFDFGNWTIDNLALGDVEDLANLNDRLNAHYDLIGMWPTSGETLAQEQLLQVWLNRVGKELEARGRLS